MADVTFKMSLTEATAVKTAVKYHMADLEPILTRMTRESQTDTDAYKKTAETYGTLQNVLRKCFQ